MTSDAMTLTVEQAARKLGISRGLAYEAVRLGEMGVQNGFRLGPEAVGTV